MDKTNHEVIKRAQSILVHLKPVFDDLSGYRWVMKGSSSLIYVTGDSCEFRLLSYLVDGQTKPLSSSNTHFG